MLCWALLLALAAFALPAHAEQSLTDQLCNSTAFPAASGQRVRPATSDRHLTRPRRMHAGSALGAMCPHF